MHRPIRKINSGNRDVLANIAQSNNTLWGRCRVSRIRTLLLLLMILLVLLSFLLWLKDPREQASQSNLLSDDLDLDSYGSLDSAVDDAVGLRAKVNVNENDEVENNEKSNRTKTVLDFLKRRLRSDVLTSFTEIAQFDFKESDQNHYFEYEMKDGFLRFSANSMSSMTKALGHFFLHVCEVNLLSWLPAEHSQKVFGIRKEHGENVNIFKTFCPHINSKLARRYHYIGPKYRYYLNQVTMGYSTTWWDCDRWLQEIDWMALRGVNLVLTHITEEITSQYVMGKVLKEMTKSDAPFNDDFSTGEQYLSWHRMGNLQSVAGPPSKKYLRYQEKCMSNHILPRLRDLEIYPVLPAFNGHISRQIANLVNDDSISQSSLWSGFNSSHSAVFRLRPKSSLFSKMGKMFTEHQMQKYKHLIGDENVYFSVDIFNEMDPRSVSNAELKEIGEILTENTPKHSKIVMQMWCFAHDPYSWTLERVRAFLSGFPPGKLILLDLHGEKRPMIRKFSAVIGQLGHSVIWTYLHNFGGAGGMAGEIELSLTEMNFAMLKMKHLHPNAIGSVVEGIGLSMESIEQNDFAYDTILEAAWMSSKQTENGKKSFTLIDPIHERKYMAMIDVFQGNFIELIEGWVKVWATARYGILDHEKGNKTQSFPILSWQCALHTVYSRPFDLVGWGPTKSVIEQRPFFQMKHRLFQPTDIGYSANDFQKCVDGLLSMCKNSRHSELYSFDVIDFVRQSLSDASLHLAQKIDSAFAGSKLEELQDLSVLMLNIIDAMDGLLLLHPFWRVENFWSPLAETESQRKQARMILTSWYSGNKVLVDYSSHQRSGLIKKVYKERWSVFLNALIQKLQSDRQGGKANEAKSEFPDFNNNWDFGFQPRPKISVMKLIKSYEAIEESWIKHDYNPMPDRNLFPSCSGEIHAVATKALSLVRQVFK